MKKSGDLMTKKMISLLLALIMALSVCGASASAAELTDAESDAAELGAELPSAAEEGVTQSEVAHVTGAEVIADGIRVSWEKPNSAAKVAILRMNDGVWERIATSAESAYTDKDTSVGYEYRYTVRALTSSGSYLSDSFDEAGYAVSRLSTPVLHVENAAGGVSIGWTKVEGAVGYRVFYKNSKGGWTRLGTTTETSLLDSDVRSGSSYTYTVRCITADGEHYNSYFDTKGKTVTYIAAPVLLSAESTGEGVKISWQASAGAAKYRVFYKNSSGGWTRLGVTTATSYVDKNVKSGSSYTYTVRCLNSADEYISWFYADGVKGSFLSAPDFTVSSAVDGVSIKWDAVAGAVNYRVYYYGSKGWTRMLDTAETSLLDSDVRSGSTYTYTVRCISADGKSFTSGYLPGKSVKYIASPIVKLDNDADGINVSWDKVEGAVKYRVYYYGSKGWTRMLDTTETSYLDESVTSGSTYTYTVRCISADGKSFTSLHRGGVSKKFVAAPDFTLTRKDGSIVVSWDKVGGAELYRVYLRADNGWKRLSDTTATSYSYSPVSTGTTYTFTVRCLNAEGNAFTSAFRAGKSLQYMDIPLISSVSNTTEGVKLTWPATASGGSKYRLYYKNGSGWTRIADTDATSYVHKDVTSGKTYTYTMRIVNAAGTAFESSFDSAGKSIKYIASPKNIQVASVKNDVKVSWTASAGAAKYRVYYKDTASWVRLGETTDASFTSSDIPSGANYVYTVRCVSADGKSFTSDFDHAGVTYKHTKLPALKPLQLTKDGINISWTEVKGAEKYRVYYYGSKGWTRMGETTSGSYLDKAVSSNSTYRYTVRCITADGRKFTSDFDAAGVKIFYIAAPKLTSSDVDTSSVTFSWSKPAGATKYRVYKRINNTWVRQLDTSSNSYTDSGLYTGTTYSYTVRVLSPDSKSFYSGFDPDGFIFTTDSYSGSGTVVNGNFVYYDQGDYSYPYGDDTIAYSGCGPTAFAMVASTLTGKTITPIDAVSWCGNTYYVDNVGTRWDYYTAASKRFGIKMEKQLGASDFDAVITALRQGKYVISAQSFGIFTRGGHFIVLAGITDDNKIIVYDPNGGNHYVGATFTRSDITASGTQYWVFSK